MEIWICSQLITASTFYVHFYPSGFLAHSTQRSLVWQILAQVIPNSGSHHPAPSNHMSTCEPGGIRGVDVSETDKVERNSARPRVACLRRLPLPLSSHVSRCPRDVSLDCAGLILRLSLQPLQAGDTGTAHRSFSRAPC